MCWCACKIHTIQFKCFIFYVCVFLIHQCGCKIHSSQVRSVSGTNMQQWWVWRAVSRPVCANNLRCPDRWCAEPYQLWVGACHPGVCACVCVYRCVGERCYRHINSSVTSGTCAMMTGYIMNLRQWGFVTVKYYHAISSVMQTVSAMHSSRQMLLLSCILLIKKDNKWVKSINKWINTMQTHSKLSIQQSEWRNSGWTLSPKLSHVWR